MLTIEVRPRLKFTITEAGVAIGAPGLSAYEVWLAEGNTGTTADYLASLKGEDSNIPGPPGNDGNDGYTPIKGVDYFDGEAGDTGPIGPTGPKGDKGNDGYTPVKGVDYFDGEDGDTGPIGPTGPKGDKGNDGYTPVKGVDYFDGEAGDTGPIGPTGPKGDKGDDGYTPEKGVDYFDGEDGSPGAPGADGNDGYTPVKGVDYFDGEDSTVPGPPGADGADGSDATVTAANIEAVLDAAAADSLADADTVNFNKSSVLKKITWANIKSALSSVFAALSGATFTGTITAPAITLPTNGQLLLTIPSTDGHATGNITNAFNSGYTSSAIGDLVYLDSSSTWQKADKGTSAATYSGLLGIALEVKASGNALKVALPGSFVYATGFPALTVGAPVYMDDAGAIVVTQPTESDHRIRKVGFSIHADKIFFFPSNDFITHV